MISLTVLVEVLSIYKKFYPLLLKSASAIGVSLLWTVWDVCFDRFLMLGSVYLKNECFLLPIFIGYVDI